MENKLVVFEDVVLGYNNKVVLKNLSFSIENGDFIGIVGSNGSGKTTMLKAILGLVKPISGRISFAGADSGSIRFGYVPQIHTIDTVYPLSVFEVVLMARYAYTGLFGKIGENDLEAVSCSIKKAGLESYSNKLFRELSGGLRQRALIARALAGEPDILVLDEPTNDLDLAGEKAVMELVKKLHSESKITIIMVSHLLNVLVNYTNKIGLINESGFELDEFHDENAKIRLEKVYCADVCITNVEGKKYISIK